MSVGSLEISEGNITWREKKKQKTKKKTPQNMHLTTTTSEVREVTQMLSSTTSKWGLGREAQAASLVLSLKTRPECPEGYLRKLM